jgi:intraflagellar transport protein 122
VIHCREYVKKISVYKDKVAVQLPKHIAIYELASNRNSSGLAAGGSQKNRADTMTYVSKYTVPREGECNLLIVAQAHFVICLEKKLQLFEMKSGQKKREWVVEVRCSGIWAPFLLHY